MTFNESNTVEAFIRDRLVSLEAGRLSLHGTFGASRRRSWSRSKSERALIRLNPEIEAEPDRAEDVLYRLRAILLGVRTDGLVKANEEFAAWLTGERSMPFGPGGEHVTIRLIDFIDPERNQCVVTTQYTFRVGSTEKRADLVLLVNGLPLVLIEAKTPVRSSESWLDGALQVHDDYERNVPSCSSRTSSPWPLRGRSFATARLAPSRTLGAMAHRRRLLHSDTPADRRSSQLNAAATVILDLLANFTAYRDGQEKAPA